MRYDAMRSRYPNIERLFAGVADYCHSEAGPDMAMGWASRWIVRYIMPKDREAVAAKVQRFIKAIKAIP